MAESKYDAKEITESFFAHKGLNIGKKTDLKKAASFLKKASWSDMFISEKYDSMEWSALDESIGNMRLKIMKDYIAKISK